MSRRTVMLLALASLVAACGATPAPGRADLRAAGVARAAAKAPKAVYAFRPYDALTPGEQRLLGASQVPVEQGSARRSLGGQQLYDYLAMHEPEHLASFLNQVAVLATVELAPGRKAIDYLKRIESLGVNHVYAETDPQLAHDVAVRASKRWQDKTQFLGPENSGLLHGKYDLSYRENRPYSSMQLCFSRQDDLTKVDIDVDEECPLAGDKLALAKHLARAAQHEFLRKLPGKQRGEHTRPDDIFRRITRAPVKPDGRPDKVGRGIQPSYALADGAPPVDTAEYEVE